jgi:PBP1b-binding outer membrane lipoprotein LpoB
VRRIRTVSALALLALALVLAACGDDDDAGTTTTTPAAEAPSGSPAPPSVDGLPPGFVECMADEGYAVESPADIHSAPPEVLQACFGAAH